MKFISSASSASCWRGYECYKAKKVVSYKQLNEKEYEAIVIGSNNEKYNVLIDIEHPRSSTCDCPYAKDKRIICKHKVALYFTIFPKEASRYLNEVEEAEKEYEEYETKLYEKVEKHINSKMTKQELRESLFYILNIAPEWVYERFVRDYIDRDVW